MSDIDCSEYAENRRYVFGKLVEAISMLISGSPQSYHPGKDDGDIRNRIVWFFDEFHVHVDELKRTLNAYLEHGIDELFYEIRRFKSESEEANWEGNDGLELTGRAIDLSSRAIHLIVQIHRFDAAEVARKAS